MASAGEVAYDGRIGSGEAQIFNERIHPLLLFDAQQEARKNRNDLDQAKLQQQQQQKRNTEVQKYIDDNVGTPGWFQQEKSVSELNDVKSRSQKYAFDNPNIDVNGLASQFGEEKGNAQRRIAKRNEIQKEIEQIRQDNNPKSTLDNNWVNIQTAKVYDRDIDEINRGEVVGIKNHPRAYDADKGIISAVDNLKNQYNYTGTGEPQDIGFGMVIDGFSKKVRFKTDAKGNITDETVDFVLDNDPAVSQRIRWDMARKRAGVEDDAYATPEEMNRINQEYNKIKFSDDPVVVANVRGNVRKTLNQLQQVQYIDRKKIQNYPASKGNEVTSEDRNNRMIKINAIKNAFGPNGDRDTPNPKALNYLGELKGIAKYQGMPVTDIKVVPGELRKSGTGGRFVKEPQLLLTVKSGVESGDVLEQQLPPISLTSAKDLEEILNNLWNSTAPTTKEKKITGNALRGENDYLDEVIDENDDDEGFLDE